MPPDGDAKRARILQTMRQSGLPMDALAASFRSGALTLDFIDTAAYGTIRRVQP